MRQFGLDGCVAAVTGAASGIGLEICRAYAAAGAAIAMIDRDQEALDRACSDLSAVGTTVTPHFCDVTRPAEADATAAAVAERHGKVDILVNSAGIALLHTALEVGDEDWRRVIDINLNGTFWMSRAFGAGMVARGSGAIVNLGSMSGLVVNRPQSASSYMASKGAVHMLTKALAAEWAGHGVRVNALAPGYVATEMTLKMRERPELFNAWLEMTPMGRCAEPAEIATAALFLASPASSYITGAIVSVDGGYTVW